MKKIQLLSLAFFSILYSYSYAQNLQFNSAVFYEYSASDEYTSYLNITNIGVLVVDANQILKITSCGGSAFCSGAGYFPTSYISINQRVISRATDSIELYLPTGNYAVGFFPDSNTLSTDCNIKGYISGVLYDIVP